MGGVFLGGMMQCLYMFVRELDLGMALYCATKSLSSLMVAWLTLILGGCPVFTLGTAATGGIMVSGTLGTGGGGAI